MEINKKLAAMKVSFIKKTFMLSLIISAGFTLFSQSSQPVRTGRVTINLGDDPWKLMKVTTNNEQGYALAAFDDSKWKSVGVPHCFNDSDTYLNASDMHMWKGTVWYRKQINLNKNYTGKKVFLEFDGINIGAAVYVNGKFKPGNSAVKQPGEVTHVGGFLPFVLDITDDVIFGAENVIAVRVSNAENSFFTWPVVGTYEGFSMGWGGIVCPVYMYITDRVHIPLNAYSPLEKWGTYMATIKASAVRAQLKFQTNVENEGNSNCQVTLITNILDKQNTLVKSITSHQSIPAKSTFLFEQSTQINNPHLWFPNNSPYGKPYLYKVVSIVQVDGKAVDTQSGNMGIRTITWDGNYCYVNGKKHLLLGFGHRNSYPALGSAVPEELQWKDIKLIADAGGNTLRIGHVPATEVMVSACDVYGIMVMQNSTDNEWLLKNEPVLTYKKEYDRDCVIFFRNHPSIAVWESNNGLAKDGEKYLPIYTQTIVNQWDSLQPRIVSNRDNYPEKWPKDKLIMVGYTNEYRKVTGSPSVNFEVYGAFWGGVKCMNIARFDYNNEKQFVNWFINDYLSNIRDSACGWIDWMLAETQGEGYTIYLNGKAHQKSLGSSAMDGNRIPKLKYNIYKNALWVPFSTKPGVVLQSNWNLSGIQDVDAWSNCTKVELFLNGKSLGMRIPDKNTKRCTWEKIQWEKGSLKAVGLDNKNAVVCSDERITSGEPDHLVLNVEPDLVKPDGSKCLVKANGSDAAIITVKVVDKDGNLCPLADNNIRFSVLGPGDYRGSYNFYIDSAKAITYHAPCDRELQAEGGLMRVAVKSTFVPGKVIVKASSDGLKAAETSFQVNPVHN